MTKTFLKQIQLVNMYVKNGVPGGLAMELPFFMAVSALLYAGVELNAQQLPFRTELLRLFNAFGWLDPIDAPEWWEAEEFAAFRQRYGKGNSSADGLHHKHTASAMITSIRAAVALTKTNMKSIDMRWLNALEPPDSPKMFDCSMSSIGRTTIRVAIAQVLKRSTLRACALCSLRLAGL